MKINKACRYELKQMKRASQKHSRKIKGSNNRKKSALKLSRLHGKIRNIRKDFLHKETTKLAKTKSVIVLEHLGRDFGSKWMEKRKKEDGNDRYRLILYLIYGRLPNPV